MEILIFNPVDSVSNNYLQSNRAFSLSSDQSIMVDPLSYFSLQPMLHNWCNKRYVMCYPVCGMVHIKKISCCFLDRSLCFGPCQPSRLVRNLYKYVSRFPAETRPDGAVAMPSANGLVGRGFIDLMCSCKTTTPSNYQPSVLDRQPS